MDPLLDLFGAETEGENQMRLPPEVGLRAGSLATEFVNARLYDIAMLRVYARISNTLHCRLCFEGGGRERRVQIETAEPNSCSFRAPCNPNEVASSGRSWRSHLPDWRSRLRGFKGAQSSRNGRISGHTRENGSEVMIA